MEFWIVYTYEPIPVLEPSAGRYRYGELVKALIARGHSVVWWTSDFDHIRKKRRNSPPILQPIERLRIRVLPSLGYHKNVAYQRVLHNRRLAREFRAVATQERPPDLVIAGLPSLEMAEAAAQYSESRRIPFVLDVHDRWPDVYLSVIPNYLRTPARVMLCGEFARVKRIARSAGAITAVSNQYLEWGLKNAARPRGIMDRVFHLGAAIDNRSREESERAFRGVCDDFGIPAGKFLATFGGTLGNSYDLEAIVGAAYHLQQRGRCEIHFVIAGSGDKYEKLRALGRGLSNLTITGWIPQLSLAALLRESGVGISAYIEGATQSLPYKPFGYMAAGVPQIHSLGPEARALIHSRRCGLYYPAGDSGALAELVCKLWERPCVVKYMGKYALRAFQREFNMGDIYPKFAVHLERVASELGKYRRKRALRVLYLHQHFCDRSGVSGTRSFEFAGALAAAGHHVTVLTGRLNNQLPKDSYKISEGTYREGYAEFRVVAKNIPYSNANKLGVRALKFMQFAGFGCVEVLKNRWDVVIATSTPLTVALPGLLFKGIYSRRAFLFEVRDLWPDMLSAFGLRNPLLLYLLSWLERRAYAAAEGCIALAPGIARAISERSSSLKAVELIPNGCDLELFDTQRAKVAKIPGVESGDFVAMYVGTIGRANGVESLIDVAVAARCSGDLRLKIVVIGSGMMKSHLRQRVAALGLNNFVILEVIPKQDLVQYLARANCCLLVFGNVPEIRFGTSPNKFFDYISAGKAVVVNYPGWMANLVQQNDCGLSVLPESAADFLSGLQTLMSDDAKCRAMGVNARKLAESKFDRVELARKFVLFVERYGNSLQGGGNV